MISYPLKERAPLLTWFSKTTSGKTTQKNSTNTLNRNYYRNLIYLKANVCTATKEDAVYTTKRSMRVVTMNEVNY